MATLIAFATYFTLGQLSLKTLFFRDKKSERTGTYSQRVFKLNCPGVKFLIVGTDQVLQIKEGPELLRKIVKLSVIALLPINCDVPPQLPFKEQIKNHSKSK